MHRWTWRWVWEYEVEKVEPFCIINWRKFFTVVEDGDGEVLQMDSKKKKKGGKKRQNDGKKDFKKSKEVYSIYHC